MQANLARKNRRIPILCMLFLLLSTIMSAIGNSISSVIPSLWKLFENGFDGLLRDPVISFSFNIVSFSEIFLYLTVFILLFKPKGWVISIPAFLASGFMTFVSVIFAIVSVGSFAELVSGAALYWPFSAVDIIVYLLPISISLSWASLGLAGISSIILHKTAKKAIRYSFAALTVAFGIISSGMFVVSGVGNVLAAIKEIIAVAFYRSIGNTACTLAPIFIFANILGFIGIILLTVYLIKPYKKTFQPHETDPEIIYAIDEDDPVFHEIDGDANEPEENEAQTAEENTGTEDTADEEKGEEPDEKQKKKKRPIASFINKIKQIHSTRATVYKIAFALLIAALFMEFGDVCVPGIGIASIFVLLYAKRRPTVVVFGILNMVLGGGPVSLIAGILMLFIPECSICPKDDGKPCPDKTAEEEHTEAKEKEIAEKPIDN